MSLLPIAMPTASQTEEVEILILKRIEEVQNLNPIPNPQQWPDRARMADPALAKIKAKCPPPSDRVRVRRVSTKKLTTRRFSAN